MTDQSSASRVFDALSNGYRRQLLLELLEANPDDNGEIDPLAHLAHEDGTGGLEVTRTMLVHSHLPKLADKGFIVWDREVGTISKGPNWEEIAQLLQLVRDHPDDLQDGWMW